MKKTTLFSNWKNFLLGFLAISLCFSYSNAQDPYVIQFQDERIEIQENIDTFEWSQMPDSARLGNGYYGWVQFYETPTQNIQDAFRNNGLQLLNYIPYHTYLFYFPENTSIQYLADSGVRAIIPVEARFKMSTALKNGDIGDWAINGDNYLVTLIHHENANRSYVLDELASKQIVLTKSYDNSNHLELSIPNNCLSDLANMPFVKWIEVIAPPPVKDDDRGRALHRASGLDTQYGAGRNYTGEGIGVLCRDDGIVGPHVDFEGRLTNLTGDTTGTHGDGVSGIMAGSGNKNPTRRGMAAGADLYVNNYFASFLDGITVDLITDGTVQVTNSSYSDGCNTGYTGGTVTVDSQMHTLETIMHIFSAGNSNGNNCGYGAGSQWGNITGGHKQGKNVIATANVFYDGSLVSSSSRGPAHDGRIKPDISANGQNQISTAPNHGYFSFGGTSGAAPGIAGISAQLYQAYAEANAGALPKGALIKAALLNTANDAGNVGPDFRFGWGIVNGLRAGILIEEGRYLSDDIVQGVTNTHTLMVPSGTTQMRVMVHWSDPAATPGANPALVNDIDLVVNDPSNVDHLPYLLDHTPDPILLNTPAGNGPDHLNNVEQVLIDSPAPGSYDVEITGFDIAVGPQEYWVVYEFIQENLTVTYPNGGELLYPVIQPLTIHWDAINTVDPFDVEYSIDGGSNWIVAGTVPATTFMYELDLPAVFTGEALVRVTSGAFSDTSDDQFTITASRVASTNVIQVCETDATFTWAAMAEAESYDLWLLGEKYMEAVGNTTETTITVPIADYEATMWYAVSPRNDTEGWAGQRTEARIYLGGLLDCELGIEDVNLDNSIILYPNPADTTFYVNLGTSIDSEVEIVVTNSLGQTIQRMTTTETQTTVDVANYNTGIYFVSISSDTQSTTKKLIVK
ncbi:MAG: S8 family serine peptidase [Flavobacteriaceae bacterium]|nr:S8 family serine peptidase [Flavobacteriaceae bacterium]